MRQTTAITHNGRQDKGYCDDPPVNCPTRSIVQKGYEQHTSAHANRCKGERNEKYTQTDEEQSINRNLSSPADDDEVDIDDVA